jgi:hypothetical protein
MTQQRINFLLDLTEAQIKKAVSIENEIGGQEALISKLMVKKQFLESLKEKAVA